MCDVRDCVPNLVPLYAHCNNQRRLVGSEFDTAARNISATMKPPNNGVGHEHKNPLYQITKMPLFVIFRQWPSRDPVITRPKHTYQQWLLAGPAPTYLQETCPINPITTQLAVHPQAQQSTGPTSVFFTPPLHIHTLPEIRIPPRHAIPRAFVGSTPL